MSILIPRKHTIAHTRRVNFNVHTIAVTTILQVHIRRFIVVRARVQHIRAIELVIF